MNSTVTKPVMLDETGQKIVEKAPHTEPFA